MRIKPSRRQFLKTFGAAAALGKKWNANQSKRSASTMPDRKTFDVAVIGAGVFGAWTAYYLQKSGATVALLDSYGPAHARASSGGESRIIRMGYGPDDIYTRWSMRALPLWKQLFDEAGQPALFRPTGVLWIAHQDEAYALSTLASLEKAGAVFEKLTLEDLRRRYPQIVFEDDSWAILEPRSGVLMARRAVQAVVERAQKLGAEYWVDAVLAPEGRGYVAKVKTASGESIAAEKFVFACGPWLPKLFPDLLGQRIFPSRQEVYFFGVPSGDPRFGPPAMPTWIELKHEFYGMPDLESRGFKIANDRHGESADPDTQSRLPSAAGIAAARNYLAQRFPTLKDAPVVETRVCQYENTSTGDFLIDRHPAFENVWLVGGGSGHGFKHGPSLGEYVAARLKQEDAIDPRFSLATKQTMQKRAVF
jgi:monomeric sarcosine oxidase